MSTEKMSAEAEKKAERKAKRKPYELSIGLRLMNFLVGSLFLILPGYLILNEDIVTQTVITFFALVVLFSGLSRMVNAFYDESIGGTRRIGRFVLGAVLITLSFVIYLLDDVSENVILALIALGLLIQGVSRLSVSLVHEVFPGWLRLTLIIVGGLAILIGLFTLLSLGISAIDFEDATLITILAIGFFFGGIARVALSLAGLQMTQKE